MNGASVGAGEGELGNRGSKGEQPEWLECTQGVRGALAGAFREQHPSPTLPLPAAKGGSSHASTQINGDAASAPSLLRSKGEGWGGVLYAHAPSTTITAKSPGCAALTRATRQYFPRTAPLPGLPLACGKGKGSFMRAYRPTVMPLLPPPFCAAKGRVGEGCFRHASQPPRSPRKAAGALRLPGLRGAPHSRFPAPKPPLYR